MCMHKIILLAASLLSTVTLAQTTATAGCKNPSLRKEIRELNYDEFNRYTNAIKKLHGKYAKAGDLSDFEKFSQKHSLTSDYIHRDPSFLPWHREFLYQYERALRAIDPLVTLPYWDWSLDSQYPHDSVVLSPFMLGGSGVANDKDGTYCVSDGAFANMHLEYADDQGPHCLTRTFNMGKNLSSFTAPEVLVTSLNEKTFSTFSFKSEVYHGSPHDNIGGDYGDFSTMYSPSDPLFYLHHAFIDLLWSKWQEKNPSVAFTYEGTKYKKTVKLTDSLKNFKPLIVNDTISIMAPRYCYQYPAYPRLIAAPDYASPSYQDLLVQNQTSSQPVASNSSTAPISVASQASIPSTSTIAASQNSISPVSSNTSSNTTDVSPQSPTPPIAPNTTSNTINASPQSPTSPVASNTTSNTIDVSLQSPTSPAAPVTTSNSTDVPAQNPSPFNSTSSQSSTSASTNATNSIMRRALEPLGYDKDEDDAPILPVVLPTDSIQSKLIEKVGKDVDTDDINNLNSHTMFGKNKQQYLNLDADALVKSIKNNYPGGKRARREIRKPKRLSNRWIKKNKFSQAEIDEVNNSAEALMDALAIIPNFESIASINQDIDTKKEVKRKKQRVIRNKNRMGYRSKNDAKKKDNKSKKDNDDDDDDDDNERDDKNGTHKNKKNGSSSSNRPKSKNDSYDQGNKNNDNGDRDKGTKK